MPGDDHPFFELIEAQIEKARKEGAFDNLSGAGKPLPVRAPGSDPMTETAQRIMAENGVLPEELLLRQELDATRAAFRDETDRSKRQDLMARLADLELRYNLATEARQKFTR